MRARRLLYRGGMTVADIDRWFVHTNAYLEAVPEQHVEYVTVYSRPRLWPRLIAGLAIAITTFAIVAMAV